MIIRKATIDDVEQFALHICTEDIEEFRAREPNRDLRETLLSHLDDNSVVCVDEDGFVYAYGGNVEGACWFLTSTQLPYSSLKTKLEFTRLIKQHAEKLLQTYPFLWNYVWIGNTFHQRFLEAIGAVFHYDSLYHSEWTGETFVLFTIGGGK